MTNKPALSSMLTWDAFRTPPPTALKEIKGGRLAGFTDIDPMWRMEAMTKHYGPCDTGWSYEIVRVWSEPAGQEILCFAHVLVSYRPDAGDTLWSAPLHGIGGSKLLASESKGLHASDEGYKMAVTDAIGTALKALGMAADVYMGKLEGSKYKPPAVSPPQRQTPPSESAIMEPSPFDEVPIHHGGQNPDAEDMPHDEQAAALAALQSVTDFEGRRIGNVEDPPCPKCNGRMWDQREPERGGTGNYPKKKPTAPDWKCRKKECGGVYWPAKT